LHGYLRFSDRSCNMTKTSDDAHDYQTQYIYVKISLAWLSDTAQAVAVL